MNVLIFNSGFGSRIAHRIKDSHKSLLNINGESILSRQLRILSDFNINKVVITTGPNQDKLIKEVKEKSYPFQIIFVHNKKFKTTNYIYSMYLANQRFYDDTLMLHGDLVFNKAVIERLIKKPDRVLIDKNKERYLKDFKAIVKKDMIVKISTSLKNFTYGLQPIYYLKSSTFKAWMNKVIDFVELGKVNEYAENALNELLYDNEIKLTGMFIGEDYCQEIDDESDYFRVCNEIKVYNYKQIILTNTFVNNIKNIVYNKSKVLIVTFDIMKEQVLNSFSDFHNFKLITYNDANPEISDIVKYIDLVDDFAPEFIVSIGGGSIIDLTKCIIDFSKSIAKHIAVPTTCGTGSESTKFAVYYVDGIKQSLNKDYLLPSYVVLDIDLLKSLPTQVLLGSVLDAFSQAIESFWALKSTSKSREYSKETIKELIPILLSGFTRSDSEFQKLQKASNFAGKAINITTTTAPHALSYNLTKLFGIQHGFAVFMTLPVIWKYHHTHVEQFTEHMRELSENIDYELLKKIKDKYVPKFDQEVSKEIIDFLSDNVNLERLSNNPYSFSRDDIFSIYKEVLKGDD